MRIFNNRIFIAAAIIFSLQFLIENRTHAQQNPLFSSYLYNSFLLGPNFAGALGSSDQTARLMLAHRFQYSGFQGAPNTSLLAFDGPFAKQNMGLGGMVYTDRAGLIQTTGANLSYAYHVKLSENLKWSLGLGANAGQQGLNMDEATVVDYTESLLQLSSLNKVFVSGSFGTHISSERLLLGLSALQLTSNRIVYQNYTSESSFEYNSPSQINLFAAYTFGANPQNFSLSPMVVTRLVAGTETQFDASLKATFKNQLFLVMGYRSGYAVSFGAGAVLNNNLTLSYTYDNMINDAAAYTGGGNEFTLGYRFFKGKNSGPSPCDNNCMSQEDADRIFEERSRELKDRMEQLLNLSEKQAKRINGLNNKVDSLHHDATQMQEDAKEVEVKDGFVANNVTFETGSMQLTTASMRELDKIAAYLTLNPSVKLSIGGHTDNSGNADVNLMLSQKRARAVYDYLVNRGVEGSRMQHQGYGDTIPVADNSTENGKSQNRRVELKITE